MTGYIANTDAAWFEFLRSQPPQEEVNFWSPSDHYLFRGAIGSPFLFRLKAPRNVVAGFGLVAYAQRMPEWLAWECFGQGNGATTLDELRGRIRRLREGADIAGRETLDQIGCIILSQPVFFPDDLWIPQPGDWKRTNLRYAGYDLSAGEGKRVWEACQTHAAQVNAPVLSVVEDANSGARYGAPMMIRPRLGQGVFRLSVTDAYGRACAITDEHSLPALEAAHIRPYAQSGTHAVNNGLLLRSDLHRLFDQGYVTVTPAHKLEVSPRLKEHFSNGKSYYPMHGNDVALPRQASHHPDRDLLRWHNENVFRA
jgi:putative restriction endonuclease